MKIPSKLAKFLAKNKIKYEEIRHRTVFTAFDKAATLKIKPGIVGKTLVLIADKNIVLALIPGNKNLDMMKLKKTAKAKKVGFISEREMKNKFKGFKIGALPPFGEIFKMQTFVDRGLLKPARNAPATTSKMWAGAGGGKNIFVNSGIYEASLKVSLKIFEKLGAVAGSFSKAK